MEKETKVDTLEKADIVKKHQGYHEMEVTFGGEGDLHKLQQKCEKNPGHIKFIPVHDFKKEHLPLDYRNDLVLDYIKAEADLTCRLLVGYISESRPKVDPEHPHIFYPFYQNRGADWIPRVGTGCVFNVVKHKDKNGINWGEVAIHTACHVVFDRDEARHTTCHFFYDAATTNISQCPSISGNKVREVKAEVKEDWSQLSFVTHDMGLVDKLEKMYHHRNNLRDKVNEKYKSYPNVLCVPDSAPKPVVIISHPHGQSKQVTVGRWTDRQVLSPPIHQYKTGFDLVNTSYRYNTATCPGSSGAPVITLTDGEWWWYRHAHSDGAKDINDNRCGYGMELLDTRSGEEKKNQEEGELGKEKAAATKSE